MLDASDPFDGDTRWLDNEAYAEEKIKALGGTDLPRRLFDLTKDHIGGRHLKARLPDDRSRSPVASRATKLIDR